MSTTVLAIITLILFLVILFICYGLNDAVNDRDEAIHRMRIEIDTLKAKYDEQTEAIALNELEIMGLEDELKTMQDELQSWKPGVTGYFDMIQKEYLKTHK